LGKGQKGFFWSKNTFNNDSNGHCPLGRRNEMGQGETRHQEMSLSSSTSGGGVRGQWSLLSSTHPIEFAHPTIAMELDFQRNTADQTGRRGARGMEPKERSGHANGTTTQIGRYINRNGKAANAWNPSPEREPQHAGKSGCADRYDNQREPQPMCVCLRLGRTAMGKQYHRSRQW
jgi:hypothetical protein